MSTSENEIKCYVCNRPAERLTFAGCGHRVCDQCWSLESSTDFSMCPKSVRVCPRCVCDQKALTFYDFEPYFNCPNYPIYGDAVSMDKHMKVCKPSTSPIRWPDPKLMDCHLPLTYPPLKDTSRPITNFAFEGPKVNMSQIENKIKDMKTEIMKEMRTEFDEKIKEMQTQMGQMKKNEEMNSSALSVLFKKEKERETQWAEREKKMDQTIDCLSLKLADLETKFNEKGPQQQEVAKDLMEDYESLKVENEKMSLENSELKDELKNLNNKLEKTRLSLETMKDRMGEQDQFYLNEKQTVARLKEKLTIQSRDYEILRTKNSELKDALNNFENEFDSFEEYQTSLISITDEFTKDILGQEEHFQDETETHEDFAETHLRGLEIENLELKKKLEKVEDELKNQKGSGSILLPEKDIHSQGPPGPLRSPSAAIKSRCQSMRPRNP